MQPYSRRRLEIGGVGPFGRTSGCNGNGQSPGQLSRLLLAPIVVECASWGKQWENKHVVVTCDNMAVVQVITALTSKDPTIMHLLRCLFYYLALHNIYIRAEHVPGLQNTIADSLSRNFMQIFRQLAPKTNPYPTPIPGVLKELLTLNHQDWLLPAWRGLLRASSRTV